MPFIESQRIEDMRKRELSIPAPALVGIVAAILVAAIVVVQGAFGAASGDAFSIQSATAAPTQAEVTRSGSVQSQAPSEDSASSQKDASSASASSGSSSGAQSSAAPAKDARIAVFVCGAVEKAGVYELDPSSRVEDAIDAAGGFRADAASESLNRARVVQDGEQITVLTVEQWSAQQEQATAVQEPQAAAAGQAHDPVASQTAGQEHGGAQAGGLVNVNTATSD